MAVIGNGASAMQLCPEIQNDVGSLTIFQRSAHWAAPFEQFRQTIPEPVRYLLTSVPIYRGWYRTRLGWIWNDRIYDSLHKDPAWKHPDRSLNATNEAHREFFTEYLLSELGDRTDLVDVVVPPYPPYGKRILMDNGWARMLRNERVNLVSDKIVEIRPHSIVTADGREFEIDVLIFATGFDATRFLSSYEVRGIKRLTPVRLIKNKFYQLVSEAESRGAASEELLELLGRARAKLGMFEGDLEEGELEIGQVSGLIQDIKPAAEIVADLWSEFCATVENPFYECDSRKEINA